MIAFWIAAAVLAAGVAALMAQGAASAQAAGPSVDPSEAVYRRQLDELEDLSPRPAGAFCGPPSPTPPRRPNAAPAQD